MSKARMTQIKTFTSSDIDKLDDDVNQWINEQTVDRHTTGFATLSTSTGVSERCGFWCSITYAVDAPSA